MEIKNPRFGNIKDMLSRDQMKQIRGGCGDCAGYATCGNGVIVGGIFDCNDFVYGADGDAACGNNGPSTSCDCS